VIIAAALLNTADSFIVYFLDFILRIFSLFGDHCVEIIYSNTVTSTALLVEFRLPIGTKFCHITAGVFDL